MPSVSTSLEDHIGEIRERLARIEAHVEYIPGHIKDHEERLRAAEKKQWLLAGVAAFLSPALAKLGLHFPFIG